MKKLIALLMVLLFLPVMALAEAAQGATLTVTGVASVTLKADYAQVSVGVSTKAKTVEAAALQNTEAIHAVIAALKEAGVAGDDIATSSYSVYAEYDYSPEAQTLSGYNVTNQLTVIIRDMAHIGATLDKAIAAGANNIYNIEFLSTQYAEAQDEAAAYAVQDAKRKAQLLADAAGLKLGSILSITESTSGFFGTARTYDFKQEAAAGNSILPGDATVSTSVTMVFEVK